MNKDQGISNMRSLYFFGDSICFGQYVSTDRVWTTNISRYLSESREFSDVLTQVTAVNGETSREALARLSHCVTSHSPDLVWIQFGLNDSNYWKTDLGAPRVSMASYSSNLEEMIERCMLSGSKKIIIATNHQVTKTLEHEPSSTKYTDNAKRYNEAVRNLCSSLNSSKLELIDIEIGMRSKFDHPSEYLLSDGVHLNEFGHSVYFELALPVVSAALTSIAFNA